MWQDQPVHRISDSRIDEHRCNNAPFERRRGKPKRRPGPLATPWCKSVEVGGEVVCHDDTALIGFDLSNSGNLLVPRIDSADMPMLLAVNPNSAE